MCFGRVKLRMSDLRALDLSAPDVEPSYRVRVSYMTGSLFLGRYRTSTAFPNERQALRSHAQNPTSV
jgi:hypothetical protein